MSPVLFKLYTVAGIMIHVLLVLAAPLLRLVAPGWAVESRFGRFSVPFQHNSGECIWVHAASVGEIQAARALIFALRERRKGLHFFVTTMTRPGSEVARSQLPSDISCQLAPLDTPQAVIRAINTVAPDVYICLETELWPMMLTRLKEAGIPMLLLNGRISERSSARYRLIGRFMARLLQGFAGIGVIQEQDAVRFRVLGALPERLKVCGNIKYDLPVAEPGMLRQKYRQDLCLDGATVFICGSTRSHEEKLLLQVYYRLKKITNSELVWIIAPRHLERLVTVQNLLRDAGLAFDLFSHCLQKGRQQNIVLVDGMGELSELYAAGDYIFCGGSLVEQGGHNIMEPVRVHKPVYFGPFMKDFLDAVTLVLSAKAGFQVQNADNLAEIIKEHMSNPQQYKQACKNAEQLALQQQGAAARQVDMVLEQI
ncbi:MAG: hypothetical protein DSY58_06770 [Desulfobulbus sp.]|nr:MAG: hypothetical protein DSY58_06770 [Desulfobulbus sp.]